MNKIYEQTFSLLLKSYRVHHFTLFVEETATVCVFFHFVFVSHTSFHIYCVSITKKRKRRLRPCLCIHKDTVTVQCTVVALMDESAYTNTTTKSMCSSLPHRKSQALWVSLFFIWNDSFSVISPPTVRIIPIHK